MKNRLLLVMCCATALGLIGGSLWLHDWMICGAAFDDGTCIQSGGGLRYRANMTYLAMFVIGVSLASWLFIVFLGHRRSPNLARARRASQLGITFMVGVSLALVVRFTLVYSAKELNVQLMDHLESVVGKEALLREARERFHQGPLPCLRYPSDEPFRSEEERLQIVQALIQYKLDDKIDGDVYALVDRWAIEHEEKLHRTTKLDEHWALMTTHLEGYRRLLFYLYRARMQTVMSDFFREEDSRCEKMIGVAKQWLTETDQRNLRELWRRFPLAISSLGLLSIDRDLMNHVNRQRFDQLFSALKVWIAEHGTPPKTLEQLPVDRALLFCHLGLEFKYKVDFENRVVGVSAPGADGWFGTKDDILRTIDFPP